MKTLLILTLLLSGCGKSDNASSPPWAQSDQNTFMTGCLSTASQAASASESSLYCQCVLDAAMAKWSANDFNASAALDSSELFNDGSVAKCRAKAGL